MNLEKWAEQIYQIWQMPIYLCGSALWKGAIDEEARDIDVRIEVPDDEFERIVGPVEEWKYEMRTGEWTDVAHRWSSMCLPFSYDGAFKTGLNIDFQFYPQSYCEAKYGEERKRRLAPEV